MNLSNRLTNYFEEMDKIQIEPSPLLGDHPFNEALDIYLHRIRVISFLAASVVALTPRPGFRAETNCVDGN